MEKRYLQCIILLLAVLILLGGCAQPEKLEKQPAQMVAPGSLEPERDQPMEQVSPELGTQSGRSTQTVDEKSFIHTVRWSGETLSRISWWYTGAGQNWPEIVKANEGLDPRKMRIGDKIIIPGHLLQRQEPMTREYRAPGTVSRELEDLAPPAAISSPQTVDLFGPIDSAVGNTAVEEVETLLPLESLE